MAYTSNLKTGNLFTILIVDDAADTREVIQRNLSAAGYRVLAASGAEDALAILERNGIDLVITDYKMPRISGLDLIRHIHQNMPDIATMMITGYPSIGHAVEAVKTGAEQYLAKPFTDQELSAAVQIIADKLMRRRQSRDLRDRSGSFGIIGGSKPMQTVFKLIKKAAAADATVLVSGESGTGKELVARAIHYASRRSTAPFVTINCTAVPESLIESELFGYVKGAFTGAQSTRTGFFQMADGGTLFLDEIGDASLHLQSKLLRVIQDRTIYPVGSSHPHKVDTRVITATNKDLWQLVQKGLFREDLYYRLNVINLEVPPLRGRQDDALLLIDYFLDKYSRDLGRPKPIIQDDALASLTAYNWPGNVRELENLIQRLVIVTDGNVIKIRDLPETMRFCVSAGRCLNRTLAQFESEYVRDVLATVGGNKTRAAKILNIDRKTLREKLKPH